MKRSVSARIEQFMTSPPAWGQRVPGLILVASVLGCSDPVSDVGVFSGGETSSPSGTIGASESGEAAGTSGAATSTTTSTTESSAGDAGSTGAPSLFDVGVGGADGTDGTTGELGCDDPGLDVIYLVSQSYPAAPGLHSFDPETLEVTSLGWPACADAQPVGLTVDRSGMLWLLTVDDDGWRHIYVVDPDSLDCTETAFVDADSEGYVLDSLTFVTDAVDGDAETLYLLFLQEPGAENTVTLRRVTDLDTMEVEFVGHVSPPKLLADLSGTGEARLLAQVYDSDVGAWVAELDTATGALLWETPIVGIAVDELCTGCGVAQWGGLMWSFPFDSISTSAVYTIDLADGTADLMVPDLGISVTAAATSTCVLYEPPPAG